VGRFPIDPILPCRLNSGKRADIIETHRPAQDRYCLYKVFVGQGVLVKMPESASDESDHKDCGGKKMDLILTVVECPPHANMLNHTKVFKTSGGKIGRAEGNDWVLPDSERILSSNHAEITFDGASFNIIDRSTNGTFVNESKSPLGPGNNHSLVSGDIISCGDYQLRVSVKSPKTEPAIPQGLGAVDFLDGGDKTTFNPAMAAKQKAASDAQELDSWLEPGQGQASAKSPDWGHSATASQDPWSQSDAMGLVADRPVSPDPLAAFERPVMASASTMDWDDSDDWWKSGSQADNSPVEQQQMRVPQPAPSPAAPAVAADPFAATVAPATSGSIDDFLGLDSSPTAATMSASAVQDFPVPQAKAEPAVAPVVTEATVRSDSAVAPSEQVNVAELKQLAVLLGLDDIGESRIRSLAPEMAAVVNETVTRLIDLLRARTAIKNELRVQHTMIQMTDNNPLKFSASAQDALKVMFGGERSAFMRPAHAVQDSFDDLSDHQVAVLNGMNSAYDAMFRHFSPENLKRFINAKDGLLGSQDARNWVAFEKYYESLKSDREASYNRLFGEEFARSYEKQLAELKNTRALNRQK